MFDLRLRGVKTPHYKNTANMAPVRIPTPPYVELPMLMHIGAPAVPVVNIGEKVKKGQLVADAAGAVSSPIYATISGTVKKIDDILISNGKFVPAMTIESDLSDETSDETAPPSVSNFEEFIAAVRNSGVVGLGGAGFPTAVKLNVSPERLDVVIINCAECEPYITSDTRTIIDNTDYFANGIRLLQKYLNVKRTVIAIEDNKKQCMPVLRDMIRSISDVEIKVLPSMYPQGAEKMLIYNTVGRVVPEGKLPIDVGAIVINCTTVATIAKYIETGIPLIEKCITVDGNAVNKPQNVIAPIGTPMKFVFEFCGGYKSQPGKLLYGGPMMGIAVPSDEAPVLKNTNAILALDRKSAVPPKTTSCIRCGRCASHCPIKLTPYEIDRAFDAKNPELLEKLKINLCMECGCCSYICPAKRPLVQNNKLGKALLAEYKKKTAKGEKK